MPIKQEILYPVFLECLTCTDEPFWQDVFNDLAYGKAPSGCYINKDCLVCSHKNCEFNYRLERKDATILFNDIYTLLTKKLNILSKREKLQKKVLFHELENRIKLSRENWSDIRRKNIKDVMYEKYAINMKNTYGLSLLQTRSLLAMLILALMFKTISQRDIIYDENEIKHINGIEYKMGEFYFDKPVANSNIDVVTTETNIKMVEDSWHKFLKNLKERRIKK